MKGTVKFFNSEKGYGFITPANSNDNDGKDVFVHVSALPANVESLRENDKVEFDLVASQKRPEKGMQAANVRLV